MNIGAIFEICIYRSKDLARTYPTLSYPFLSYPIGRATAMRSGQEQTGHQFHQNKQRRVNPRE